MVDLDALQADIRVDCAVSRLMGKHGQLTGIEIVDLSSGQSQTMDADHLIFSAGRFPELIFVPVSSDDRGEQEDIAAPVPGAWQAVPPYKQPAYHLQSGLMARGDNLTDFQAAIKAIAAGRRAAVSIHQLLYNLPLSTPDNVVTPDTPVQNVDQVTRVPSRPRLIMPMADASQTVAGEELEEGYQPMDAKAESQRCLQCGLICYLRESDFPIESEATTA